MSMWGRKPRLGEVNPEEAPYRNELALDNIEIFDLTGLKKAGDNAHDRALRTSHPLLEWSSSVFAMASK